MTTLPRAYGFEEAATKLRNAGYKKITENWLRRHLSQVPHTRIGREITFTDEQLLAFLAAHSTAPPKPRAVTGPQPVDRRRRGLS